MGLSRAMRSVSGRNLSARRALRASLASYCLLLTPPSFAVPEAYVTFTDEHVIVDRDRGPLQTYVLHTTRPTPVSHAKTSTATPVAQQLALDPMTAHCGYSDARMSVWCLTTASMFRPIVELNFIANLDRPTRVTVTTEDARRAVLNAVANAHRAAGSSFVAPRIVMADANRCRSDCSRRVVVEVLP